MDSMAGEQKDGERITRPLDDVGQVKIAGLAGSIQKQFPASYFGDKIESLNPHEWTV